MASHNLLLKFYVNETFSTPYYRLVRTPECQGYQYHTGGRTGLATDTIYFGYQSILMYRFGFTAILYIYIYIYMYVCMCLCIYIYIYIIINIKVYHKTFPQFRTNYSWFYTLVSIKWEKNIKK